MNPKNKNEILLKSLIWMGERLSIAQFRPLVAYILTNRSKTTDGYNRSCEMLVEDHQENRNIFSLSARWWETEPVVNAKRLGIQFSLDLRDNLQRCVYFTGRYEPELLSFICKELQKDDCFIDVGAHVGVHALIASNQLKRLGGGKVIAFEPTPDSAKKLEDHAESNGLYIELHQYALGSKNAQMPLYGDCDWGIHDAGVRSLFGKGPVVCQVEVVRFDNWIKDKEVERIDVIKIDAEGAEYDIIQGMQETLVKYRPRCIIMELKESVIKRTHYTSEDVLKLMKSLGYWADGNPVENNQIFRKANDSEEKVYEERIL